MGATRRAPWGQRTCTDCAKVYPLTDGHADLRWCPACTTRHLARCSQCTQAFDRDGRSRLCPSCREQVALFDVGDRIAGVLTEHYAREIAPRLAGGGR